jgi:integrase
MRPGEIVSIHGCDLNMAGKVWEYVPGSHKTSHHGKRRIIFLGPKAQEVVREFLKPDLQAPLFDPREGRSQFLEGTRSKRRKQTGKRQASTAYTSITYAVAVRRACVKAKIPHWHPHQLRHTAATEIRREAGLETARVVLGHSTAAMTEVYAQADESKARKIMGKIG